MRKENHDEVKVSGAPPAIVNPGRSLSIIWVVPIVAMLIAAWLALTAWSEKGPVITIAFENADGLEAQKTKIKFKDVEVGKVTRIELNDDLTGVIVTAEMKKTASRYMREETQFWVVRARVAAGEVSGLGTLFTGAYIGCNPSLKGAQTSTFSGLEKPPVITTGLPGRHYTLQTQNLGSLDIGSPVYYRGIKVGQVVEYDFDSSAESVNVRVFINAPYHERCVRTPASGMPAGLILKSIPKGSAWIPSLLCRLSWAASLLICPSIWRLSTWLKMNDCSGFTRVVNGSRRVPTP